MIRVDILGEQYEVLDSTDERFDSLNAVGLCEWWDKKILIKKDIGKPDENTMLNLTAYRNNIIKHEVIHAFLFESGMVDYERDELLVEWIARNLDRMIVACGQALQEDKC